MKNIIKSMFYSRRTFLGLMGAAGIASVFPPSTLPASTLSALGESEKPEFDLRPITEILPDGYEAYVANPNFAAIWNSNRTPLVKTDAGLAWVERLADGTMHMFAFDPKTAIERADAAELFDVYFYKSWRTFAQLSALVKGKGPWVVRLTVHGTVFGLITRKMAPKLLAMERIDPVWWTADDEGMSHEINDAALLNTEQVLRLFPRLQATVEDADSEWAAYYEPVTPANAHKDLRVFQLRKSGWGPQVGEQYDLKQLEEIFKPQSPLIPPEKHPFIRVPDAWIALIDMNRSPGSTEFISARSLFWACGCPCDPSTGEYAPCDCLPPEMRENEEPVISYIFARKDGRGGRRYIYLGLGHLGAGTRERGVYFELVPAMLPKYYQALGGELLWQAAITENDDDYRELGALNSCSAAKRCISATDVLRSGCFSVNRWGPDEVNIRFFGDRCIAQARGSSGTNNFDEFLIDPNFSGGEARALVTLSDHWGELTVCAEHVLPRTMVAPLINELAKGGDYPPNAANWSRPEKSEAAENEEATKEDDN